MNQDYIVAFMFGFSAAVVIDIARMLWSRRCQ